MQDQDSRTPAHQPDEEIVERIMDALADLLELLGPHVQTCASNIGLAAPYALGLRRIDGSTPMKDLAQRLHCDPSFVTAIADALEEHGFATRQSDPHDRRVKNLVLTPAGRNAQAQFRRELATEPPGIRRLRPAERDVLIEILTAMTVAETRSSAPEGPR